MSHENQNQRLLELKGAENVNDVPTNVSGGNSSANNSRGSLTPQWVEIYEDSIAKIKEVEQLCTSSDS